MSKLAIVCRIRILRLLVHKLGSEKAAHLWLNKPHPHFDNRCPGDFLFDDEVPLGLAQYVEARIL